MGWVDPITLSPAEAAQITLEPYDVASKAYKIDADVNDENFSINPNYTTGYVSNQTKKNLKERAQGEFCCSRISETRAGTSISRDMACWYGASTMPTRAP